MAIHNEKWDEFRELLREWKQSGRVDSEQYWKMLYLVEEYGYASELHGLKAKKDQRADRRVVVEGNLTRGRR